MDKITSKLLELEEVRECVERCQRQLREEMLILDKEEYLEKELIYQKNREELKSINEKITTLNNALDILENIG